MDLKDKRDLEDRIRDIENNLESRIDGAIFLITMVIVISIGLVNINLSFVHTRLNEIKSQLSQLLPPK